jgi:hypothetical protein
MKHKQIFVTLFIALLLPSCRQVADNPLNGSAVTWAIPTIGTSYVYQITEQDPAARFDTITILQTGQHLGGKTGVVGCLDNAGTIGTFFYNIEPNGDISYGDSTLTSPSTYTWTTFPTASQQPISDPVEDTTESGIHIFRSNVRTFVGAENITTTAGQFSTLHVRQTSISIITGPDSLDCNASDTALTDTWFAPTVGLYVKVVNSGTEDGQASRQSEVDLVKYLPK